MAVADAVADGALYLIQLCQCMTQIVGSTLKNANAKEFDVIICTLKNANPDWEQAEVPCVTAEAIARGHGSAKAAGKSEWKKNCSRNTWRKFRRAGFGLNVPLSSHLYQAPTGEVVEISYLSPIDLVKFLLEKRPAVLVGGVQDPDERAKHLQSFWKAFRLYHPDHMVFEEHQYNLGSVIPMCWHGDEGRGKRRGNTVVVSCEACIGIHTVASKKVKPSCDCGCSVPVPFKRKYSHVAQNLDAAALALLGDQWTNMKGNSFLQHFAMFIIPSSVHHVHPQVLMELLKIIARDFRRLFFEGITVRGKHFCVAVVAGKGDLKWFCKIALERSFQNQGVVRDIPCCHECQAGGPGLMWEDLSQQPSWAASRFSQRPWTTLPPMYPVPFCRQAPEKMYKRDLFHCCKVGIYRDLAGSCICWLAAKGYYGTVGDFQQKLENCHGIFKLYCSTTGKTASLRTFSRALFMYPRFSAYPWANTKGSDTMILLAFLQVQCAGFINIPLDQAHLETLELMKQTCGAALGFFKNLNGHGLWLQRDCAMAQQVELTKFIAGYATLASRSLNEQFCGWAIKPKLHLLKHAHLEMHEWLLAGSQVLPNHNLHGCEMNEDYIGRCCRLSRRLDSRKVGERVLQCALMKSSLLYRQFMRNNRLL